MKQFWILLFFGWIGIQDGFSQVVFGEYSDLELELEKVPFQPGAKIVTLWEEANSYFMVNGLQTDYHFRFKVLDDNPGDFGDFKIEFYRGKSLIENVTKVKGQVSYLENGVRKSGELSKDQIKEVDLGGGEFQYVLVFPHVKTGTILEFSYRKIDQRFAILEGWAFQRRYPALFSKYTFKAPDFFQYQMIIQGKKVAEASTISTRKNLYSWLRTDVPSLPVEPFVGNPIDYQERVDGYLYSSEYVNPAELEHSEMIYSSWKQLANRWLDFPDMKSYFVVAPEDIPNYPILSLDSLSPLEKAKVIHQYVAKNIKLLGSSWLEPIYPIESLLSKKIGNSFDKNLLMANLLRREGIIANLILVNEKDKGRSQLVEVPFLHQFHSSLLEAEIEGKYYLLDASDSIVPFGLLPIQKLAQKGFVIAHDKGRLQDLSHQHRSGEVVYIQLNQTENEGVCFQKSNPNDRLFSFGRHRGYEPK